MNKPRYQFANKLVHDVPIIKTYTGMDASILDYYLDQKLDGLVIEAMGRGNVPPQLVKGIAAFAKKHIPVLITSRVPSGRVFGTYGYEGGGKDLVLKGAILAGDLSGLKARLFLMVALGNGISFNDLTQYFE
jgi:L-asparaginase